VTVAGGTGLTMNAAALSLQSCAAGQVLKVQTDGGWDCASSGGSSASPNLMVDGQVFSSIPTGPTNVTSGTSWGPWTYTANDTSTLAISVEDAPTDLTAIVGVSGGARPYKVLHLKFTTSGATGGRVMQTPQASDKAVHVTTSAYVKVLSGQLTLGPVGSTSAVSNAAWQRVSATDAAPARTLGGSYGFSAQGGVTTEVLLALPKVELGDTATAWIDAPWGAAGQIFTNQQGPLPLLSGTGTFVTTGRRVVVILSGTARTTLYGMGVNVSIDSVVRGTTSWVSQESNSNKAFPTMTLLLTDLGPGTHFLRITALTGTDSDPNDSFNVTYFELP
jgi:hypothetical protein